MCVIAYILGVTRADSLGLSWSQPVWPRRTAETTTRGLLLQPGALETTTYPPGNSAGGTQTVHDVVHHSKHLKKLNEGKI